MRRTFVRVNNCTSEEASATLNSDQTHLAGWNDAAPFADGHPPLASTQHTPWDARDALAERYKLLVCVSWARACSARSGYAKQVNDPGPLLIYSITADRVGGT